ncbi:MAG TPA: hypothetical protein ENJ96_09665 [Thermodesulfatator atlanticus]|uniref:DUF8082 domain-containing protein n=1 Tax=Thermodesulfatator atlanticus TaxID=501497 RepID=A0A7V5U3E7_9BACT|nr:hypothetical protein [Thermodesulfatator atlanticus]
MKSLLTSLIKLEDVNGVLVSREGSPIFAHLPEVFGPELQEVLFHSFEELYTTFKQSGRDQPEELVVLFERGSLVVKDLKGYQVLLILKTATPSPLVSVALNTLSLKLEKLAQKPRLPSEDQELIPLVLFNELVRFLLPYYGPAAKLMVKKALKQADAKEKGLPLTNASLFLKVLRSEIDDPALAQKVLNKAKEIIRSGRIK